MPLRTRPVRITILLAAADYRVFVSATRELRRIMGAHAPDVTALIVFNLQDRDATGLADDYLDAIRWPGAAGRIVSLKSGPGRARPAPVETGRPRPNSRKIPSSVRVPDDVSRN